MAHGQGRGPVAISPLHIAQQGQLGGVMSGAFDGLGLDDAGSGISAEIVRRQMEAELSQLIVPQQVIGFELPSPGFGPADIGKEPVGAIKHAIGIANQPLREKGGVPKGIRDAELIGARYVVAVQTRTEGWCRSPGHAERQAARKLRAQMRIVAHPVLDPASIGPDQDAR